MSIRRRDGRLHDVAPPVSVGERRSSCRYSAIAAQAWIGWWEGAQFRHVAADVEDISLRGALLTIEQFPPVGQPVWFQPPGGGSEQWLEVRVIEAKKRLFGPRRLRVSFRKTVPYEQFKAVVYGTGTVGVAPPQGTGEAQEHDWW